jgi:hypothetical protein
MSPIGASFPGRFGFSKADALRAGAQERHEKRQADWPGTNKPEGRGAIRASLAAGKGIHKTARECGVGTGTVQRIKREMAAPEAR